MKYNFKKLEKKWQKKWGKEKAFLVKEKSGKKKYYVLEMFPYPSALGLHLGHVLNYTIGDILARFKRMRGFNVLYPMGFDALGLPAENAAIKAGKHPKLYTAQAIKNYIKQMKNLGLSYDWSKLVSSMEPEYYKWNQLFFLKFLEKGMAYRKKSAVNWCPECNSVLANEQVHNGKCWRHEGTEVEIKHLEQWFLKITDYADELLDGIDDLQWPQKIKTMQKNWIGKSYGTEIDFEIEGGEKISNVVLIHGAAFYDKEKLVQGQPIINKRNWTPWLKKELEEKGINCFNPLMPKPWKPNYEDWKKVFEKNEINENSVLIGHSAGGAFLVRWLGETKRKIKKLILVAPSKICPDFYESYFKKFYDFKINKNVKDNVEEIVIFLSDDSRDIVESAKVYQKELGAKLIELKGRGHFIEKHMGTKKFPEVLEEISLTKKFPIFTTRPDTIYGVTFMVISAQHEKLMELVTKEQKKQVEKFLKKIKSVSEKDADKLNKEGVFTGSYAINPINGDKVPVYAGNFVVAEYGSGMVMGVPAHDQRDFDFAKKYGLPIRRVVANENCARSIVWGSEITKNDLESIGVKIIEEIKTKNDEYDEIIKKVEFPENVLTAFEKLIQKKLPVGFWNEYVGPNGVIFNFKNKDGSIVRLKLEVDNEKEIDKKCYEFFHNKKVGPKWKSKNVWKSLACAENNFYRDLIMYLGKGKLENSNKFNQLDNEKAKEEITKFLEKKKLGRKSVQFKMRDWLISRQRYWGTPIPVVYCDKCGIVAVDEKDLPVILPEKVKFGKGNPLATNEKFVNVKCPKCNAKARRETDTMDTFVDSSWYFMRYPDNKNSKEPFDKKIEADWLPVDQYIGGIEHATMHLLYARFWTKALRDLGYVNYDEPFTKLFNQGMLHGEDGEKMSKSKGNVILPEVVSEKYGIDTARFFLMSLAAPDKPRDWSDKGVQGSLKFINKVMSYFDKVQIGKSDAKTESKLNKTIKEVTEQIENFKYNLAVIKIRDLFNSLGEEESKDVLEKSLKLLHPFCPHITEELWEKIGGKGFIILEKWPVADEKKIDEKFEKQEQAVEKLKSDIEQIKKLTGKKDSKVYVYVLPNELKLYSEIKDIEIFAVNDKKKYDPENKSKKVKPNRSGIYLE